MDKQVSSEHKFKQDSGMTFEEVFEFAYRPFVSRVRGLAAELERGDFVELLQKVSSDAGAAFGRELAESASRNDFETWKQGLREPDRLFQHALTYDVREESETAFEIKVTECLWAKTFREMDAADIGYATICHPDFANCQAFNPKMRMIRSKTLMQGDDYCNHRWVWED